MANTATFTCRVEFQGGTWLVWQGSVLVLTTTKPTELIAATKGHIAAPKAVSKPKAEFESTEAFLARGGKIRKVVATALGFEFSEEEIAKAVAQVHGEPVKPVKTPPQLQIELDNSEDSE